MLLLIRSPEVFKMTSQRYKSIDKLPTFHYSTNSRTKDPEEGLGENIKSMVIDVIRNLLKVSIFGSFL